MEAEKIDELIALNVMGWEQCKYGFWETEFGDLDAESEWGPSEDIEDAWLVVGKFDNAEIHTNINGKVLCRLWVGHKHFAVKSETVPLAISLAALKAVGVEGKDGET